MPGFRGQELTEEQKLEKQLSSMGDSVWLINKLMIEGGHDDETHEIIDNNIKHLEIMLGKDFIINSGRDLTAFTEIIVNGNAYINL